MSVHGVVPIGVPVDGVGAESRLVSVDAYRGLVMLLIFGEVLQTCAVATALPASTLWQTVCGQQTHAAWQGMSVHDLIQPSFYFLVGLGLLLSRTRKTRTTTSSAINWRVIQRSIGLVVLGMALISIHPRRWQWSFVDTLTQIGLAYPFLAIISTRRKRDWCIGLIAILVGYWLWFALSPLPSADFDYAGVNVSSEWLRTNGLHGFAAHWQKNSNAAWQFDQWFLNLFPRDTPHAGYPDGLTTLNFIPSIGTMILGLFAGSLLLSGRSHAEKVKSLCAAGLALLIVGGGLAASGVCPMVKAIWTPSWVLVSGGCCFLILAGFHLLVDWFHLLGKAVPLTAVGMNSLLAYSMTHVYPALAFNSFKRVFGSAPFLILGKSYEPFLYGTVILAAYWATLLGLHWRRIYFKL